MYVGRYLSGRYGLLGCVDHDGIILPRAERDSERGNS